MAAYCEISFMGLYTMVQYSIKLYHHFLLLVIKVEIVLIWCIFGIRLLKLPTRRCNYIYSIIELYHIILLWVII